MVHVAYIIKQDFEVNIGALAMVIPNQMQIVKI